MHKINYSEIKFNAKNAFLLSDKEVHMSNHEILRF